jgi:hypothetical protein
MTTDASYSHLAALTTPYGVYEHALGAIPRTEHGYCIDDAARALVVTVRQIDPPPELVRMRDVYLDMTLAALHDDGLSHNRRAPDGSWSDEATSNDHWGRAVWALGIAATSPGIDAVVGTRAREGADRAMAARSTWPRSMAYAAIGASRILASDPSDGPARRLLADAREVLSRRGQSPFWPWPENRLTYANSVLPEAMISLGTGPDDELRQRGLTLLAWLVDQQTVDGRLSVVPSVGRAANDRGPAYAQQPIEVATLAEACLTAYDTTGDESWLEVIDRCLAWFEGANDGAVVMHDASTGGGYDGLEAHGVNVNQGAESTLAWLATVQIAAMRGADSIR